MTKRIIIASNNSKKVREITSYLDNFGIDIIPQAEFDIAEADEIGLTFVENALLKARHASYHCSLPAIADDSGLVVDALNGAPGVFSSRFAGLNASEEANIEKLLKELKEVPESERTARFYCVMVYLTHAKDPSPQVIYGCWEGKIMLEPSGVGGFGYDPVFWVPTHQCSAAQLSLATKNEISHRGQALKKLIDFLKG